MEGVTAMDAPGPGPSHALGPRIEYVECGEGAVPRGFRAVFVEGNGDCLYHAFAHGLVDPFDPAQRVPSATIRRMGWQPGATKLNRAGRGATGLRGALARYVRRHLPATHGGTGTVRDAARLFELFDPEDRSVEGLAAVLRRIETPGMWASFPETVMLARMSRSCVVMYHSPKGWPARGALLVHPDGAEGFDAKRYDQRRAVCAGGERTVYLLNRDNKHFEALEPCDCSK